MDVKERKPYRSLTRRRDAERRYTSSSAESEEGKIPQKSYSSSETLKAYDQDSRLTYGNRLNGLHCDLLRVENVNQGGASVDDLQSRKKWLCAMQKALPSAVMLGLKWRSSTGEQKPHSCHHIYSPDLETSSHNALLFLPSFLPAGANFSLRELGLEDVSPPHGTLYRTDLGLPHCGYSLSAGSDADTEADAVMSPEHPVRLWGRNTKSGRSSCLSSRANSNLTLTDTEHENTET
ncbi:hypothetical protein lerEdw1_005859, partial [Lerista edwardsae]